MAGTTPFYNLPYPGESDTPDGAAQIQSLATAVDTALGGAFGSKQPTFYVANGTLNASAYPNAKALIIECWGSGGASGAAVATTTSQSSGGGGGKGGSYSIATKLTSSLTFPLAIVVGTGGTGGAGAGGNGALTSVKNGATTYCAAAGGNGGTSLTASGTLGYSAGGLATTGVNVGDLSIEGSDGGPAFRWSATGVLGGEGGAAAAGGGTAAAAAAFGASGTAGKTPGGGAGAPNQANVAGALINGSSGANGMVRIQPIY